jgi:hypothetical protein
VSIPGKAYIPEAIKNIEALLDGGADRNILYACLELRRALEAISYNRLAVHLCDIEGELLTSWQPSRVLKFLVSEVDEHATVGAKMAVAKPDFCGEGEPHDIPEEAWVHLGEQKEVNVRALNSLYQALSSFLHVSVPRKKDRVTTSFEAEAARQKVDDALKFLREFCDETALLPLPFEKYKFPCSCGYINQRSAIWLREGRVFSCGRSDCNESYEVKISDVGFYAERRRFLLKCHRCKEDISIPVAAIPNRVANYCFSCMHCDAQHELSWQPAYKLKLRD